MALNLRSDGFVESYIQDIVRRLMELHLLEERLAVFQRNHEKTADIQSLVESVRANIPLSILDHHDRLRQQGKRSVAEVWFGVCSGCGWKVEAGQQTALKRCETPQPCTGCGRYLYLVETEASALDSAARRPASTSAV